MRQTPGEIAEFDYGKEKNLKVYNQETPPVHKTAKVIDAGVPIAMYVGKHDLIVLPSQSRSLRDMISPSIVEYLEIDGGHQVFMVGTNQTYFSQNAMAHFRKYNPVS